MRYLCSVLLLAGWVPVHGAPFLVSDPYAGTPAPTHCGIYVDAAAKIEVPVVKDASGIYCKYDLSAVATGSHVVKATHIIKDALWGTLESGVSSPLAFARPASPTGPAGLALSP